MQETWVLFPSPGRSPGEGNGNPLQYSCLKNPRDGVAWWAAVYGVAQGQTWLKWLSSSSSSPVLCLWSLCVETAPRVVKFKASPLKPSDTVKNLPAMWETCVQSLGWEDPLEDDMATHFIILAWRIPGMGEPDGLLSMGSHRVRHDWSDLAAAAAARPDT